MKRTLRIPDPDQLIDHEGIPEDGGPLRYVNVTVDPEEVSPQLAAWIERKRKERIASEKLTRIRLRARHKKSTPCPECGEPAFASYRQPPPILCVLCEVLVDHSEQIQMQVGDIHP